MAFSEEEIALIKASPEYDSLREMYSLAKATGDPAQVAAVVQNLNRRMPQLLQSQQLRQDYNPAQAGLIAAGDRFAQMGEGARMLTGDFMDDPQMVAGAEADRDERQRLMSPLERARPIATTVGGTLPDMVVPGGTTGGIARRLFTGGLSSGLTEGLASGGHIPTTLQAGAMGSIGTGAGIGLQRLAFGRPRTGTASPVGARQERLARNQGYELTPADVTRDETQKQWEASMRSSPWTARPFMEIEERNSARMNNAARRALDLPQDGDMIDETLFAARKGEVSDEYERILGGDETFTVRDQFFDAEDMAKARAAKGYKGKDKITRHVDEVARRFGDRGAPEPVSVSDYQDLYSDLGEDLVTAKGRKKKAYRDMRNAMDTEFDNAFGQLDEVKEIRRFWQALKQLEDSKALQSGNFTPVRLYNFANRKNKPTIHPSPGDGGDRTMMDSAIAANTFKDRLGNSGTTTRSAMSDLANMSLPMKIGAMTLGNPLARAYLKTGGDFSIPRALGMDPGATATQLTDFAMPRVGREMLPEFVDWLMP